MDRADPMFIDFSVALQILKRLHEVPLNKEAREAARELLTKYRVDGFAETRAQLDELAQQAEGSHRQHISACEDDALTGVALTKAIEEVIAEDDRQHIEGSDG